MKIDTPPRLPPHFQDQAAELLAGAGRTPEAADALLALDRAMFLWHRHVARGGLPAQLIAALGLDLELAQFHALTAMARIEAGIGRSKAEAATVGLLSEEMGLDPSRASRIAGELIAKGYLRREADQGDGRRTVLRHTDKATQAMAALRERKWAVMIDVFADWPDANIRRFAELFDRYREGMARACDGG